MLPLFSFGLLAGSVLAQQTSTQNVEACDCGFYDADADVVLTDSSIVYFNETDGFPETQFVKESYEHRYDRGWNTMYREGSSPDNIDIGNDTTARNLTSLQLFCDPSTDEHLVLGASIRTARQDIFFGSFRSSMRAPRHWLKGSALSMWLHHNQTEQWDLDVMNTDNGSWAWVSMLAKGQFSDIWLGTNFTDLISSGMNPWYYTEYRVDWTRDSINYYIGGELQLSYTKKINHTLPSTPAPLRFKHWSTGNEYNTMGPPGFRSEANIGWTRLFFNSSLMTKDEHHAFDTRCRPTDACRMDDYSLRGATSYSEEAAKPWKQHHPGYKIPWVPLLIDIIFASIFTVLVAKTISRRWSGQKLKETLGLSKKSAFMSSGSMTILNTRTNSPSSESIEKSKQVDGSSTSGSDSPRSQSMLSRDTSYASLTAPPLYSGMHTPAPQYTTPVMSQRPSRVQSSNDLTIEPIAEHPAQSGSHDFAMTKRTSPVAQPHLTSRYREDLRSESTLSDPNPFVPRPAPGPSTPAPEGLPQDPIADDTSMHRLDATRHVPLDLPQPPASRILHGSINETQPAPEKGEANVKIADGKPATAPVPAGGAGAPVPFKRVDYLAGFIGFSAILVTLNHFFLTFCAAVIEPSVKPHYQSEIWARKTIATYFLDPLWIGPFLMISTRFLVSNYLRTGNLANMAQKIVVRPFRLLTPVASIALLEYFLMDSGAINWLEFLPSVTWSPWPFTSVVANPGLFISEILQLAFLIPNAAPMITYNYCTGVLWTIPVQLQGAWQTLLALIMIKEVKTPWKRFAFYAFCIVNHWYAQSWGSYYYAGVLLADLDLTFKYQKWLHTHPFVYYPVLWLMILVALGGFSIDLVVQWTGVNYATFEYGWHPDTATGLSISQAGNSIYPDYFIPRLNALLATVSMQTIAEISPRMQKILSAKFLQLIFPHIFTIYLIHGFIFWSVGSWAMISFFTYGLPYWACVLCTAVVSYGTLFASLPILTPPIEAVGKKFTMNLWEHASQEPIPKRGTTWPFGKDLLERNFKETEQIRVEERRSVEMQDEKHAAEAGAKEKEVAV